MDTKQKLLLVEDEEELVRIVQTYFLDEGYDVRIAMNAEEALGVVELFKPHIIVSDVRMGRMDGFQFLATLREKPWGKNIPFIFLTIMDDRPSVERAAGLGADGYITKPFDVEDLHEKVKQVLAKRK
jgi:DNA-binding response OmpR family regulator